MDILYKDKPFFLLSMNVLTSSSSGSSQRVSVCGTIWPLDQSASWLCKTAHEPHGSPSSSSFHGDQGGSHDACDATQCARSEATKERAIMHFTFITMCNTCKALVLLLQFPGN